MLSGTVRKLKITFVSLSLSVSRFSTHEQNLAAGDEKEAEEPEKEAEERCKIQLPSRFLLQDSASVELAAFGCTGECVQAGRSSSSAFGVSS
jgi:hypothetical protein